MTKTFNTNETGLKYPLIIRGLKGNNDKPTGMPNDFEHKKTYEAILINGNYLMFHILKDENNQLSILYPNGEIMYGGETTFLPAIKDAIKNAIYYI